MCLVHYLIAYYTNAHHTHARTHTHTRTQESHEKAESCLKFVSKLQEPCLELSKAEPKAIPALLPRLLHTVRIISLHSDHYRSRERITALLRKVGLSGQMHGAGLP